ncbi:MAG: polyribonucleotide nucleotidyltransferase [Bacteroidetes bacterium]|nr:MAG: polyribonucleotide nucleotidyltransferase [Bacteroidota bacterium]
MYNEITKSINLPDGRTITIQTGKLAKQAHGSVVVRLEDTMLLATVVSNYDAKEGIDFLPLTVDYREKFAAAGRFPGGFFKREARPSELEILTMRLVDRALRPLFPNDYHCDTQVMIQLMSSDGKNLPDALTCLAASAAISVSDIPFAGPVSEVRVARIDGNWVINPTIEQVEQADLEMIVAGTLENIVMVEGEMKEVSEEEMVEAIKQAHETIKLQCIAQKELEVEAGKTEKREYAGEDENEELHKTIRGIAYDKFYQLAKTPQSKEERRNSIGEIKDAYKANLTEEELLENGDLISKYFSKTWKEAVRSLVLEEGIRIDGRSTTEIRPIWTEVNYLPGTHGSAIFTRGETQSLTTLTLGNKKDEQIIDTAMSDHTQPFMLHYNFPSFSTGEARPIRGVSRREVGHGNLAYRALKQVLPTAPENPYTVRLVSEILESNGSSSMATVCAGTMALMDGGVKISKPVSGIAMGLITDENGKYAVLSDILGDEDHLGDMDFKITGTKDGITACQMDIKVDGLSYEVLTKALLQAKEGRSHILNEMLKTIDKPNEDYKPHTPRIIMLEIPKDMIGAVIGPGGKVIQEIQAETDTTISIEEEGDKGFVQIFSPNLESITKAEKWVRDIAFPPIVEVGEIYQGKIKTIMPYGAFVEILPGTDGLLHVSEIDWKRVEKVEDVLKEGEIVEIKVVNKDPKTGKYKLSRKVLLPRPENN